MKLINYYSNQSRFEFRIQLYVSINQEYKYSFNAIRKILNKRVKIWKNASEILKIFCKN